MKRHPALIGLSHDHHHTLVQARRLRRAAGTTEAAVAVADFARFFGTETVAHFRQEEEEIFPLVADVDEARPLVAQALVEHQQIRAAAMRLERDGSLLSVMRELGDLLEAHVRLEERELFPLIERYAAAELEQGMRLGGRGGPVWGEASEDLNATLLEWPAGGGPPEHVNDELDVFVCVVDGSAMVTIDGEERRVPRGEAVVIPKGRRRAIVAGPAGARYLTVHLRRPPLQIVSPLRRATP